MGSNRSTSHAMYQPSGAAQAAGMQSECYVEPAPVVEVLLDQLRYLLSHKGASCAADCADCERLAGAQSWLLLPFRATATQGARPPANTYLAEAIAKARL
ncbi:MAG TPA: hypothetical protein VLY24_21785 [Bryobacteraceae bacterium]|nr:hypothetical protein [Bryobacteraceae bacterium]